jgi:hypothetical protein
MLQLEGFQEEALDHREVWTDLRNLATYKRARVSRLTRASMLCPLCGMSVETWRRLSDVGRWHRLQDGLMDLLASRVQEERSPWRAAAYGFLWIRFFWRMSREEAQEVLSKEPAIREALDELLEEKNPARMWSDMCTSCFQTWRRAGTVSGSGGHWRN